MANEKIIFDTEVKVGSSVGSVKSLKAELRAVTNELGTLEQGSEAFIKAAQKAGELKDRIGDIKNTVNAFNPEAKFQALAGAVGIAANGFSAMQGAMALMGSENEDLNKTIAQTQGAIALATGLNGLLGMKDAFVLLRTTSIATFASMKASIMATGLGGLIIAIAAVATAFYAMATASEASSKRQIKAINDTQDKLNEQYDLEIAIAKAAGRNTTELERGKIEDKRNSAREAVRISQEQLDKQLWINDDEQKAHDELVKNKKSIDNEYLIFEAGVTKTRLDKETKFYEDKATKDKEAADKKKKEDEVAKAKKDAFDKDNLERAKEYDDKEKKRIEDDRKRKASNILADQEQKASHINDLNEIAKDEVLSAEERYAALDELNQKGLLSDKETSDAKIAIAKKEKDARLALFDSYAASLNTISGLVGKNTVEGKALAIAAATISTYTAIAKTLEANAANTPLAIASAIGIGLTGFAAVKSIIDTPVPNTSGGGGGGGVAPTAPRIPQSVNGTMLNQNKPMDINNTNPTGKVIVVETDITATQDKVKGIIRKATIK
jgi:hypothetical protein